MLVSKLIFRNWHTKNKAKVYKITKFLKAAHNVIFLVAVFVSTTNLFNNSV